MENFSSVESKKIRQLFPYMDLKDYMIMLFYHNDADGTDLEL